MKVYKYNKRNKIKEDYIEIPYTKFASDGSIRETGTEDFSVYRMLTQIKRYYLYVNSGMTNKGGHIIWKCLGLIYVDSIQAAYAYCNYKHYNASETKLIKE